MSSRNKNLSEYNPDNIGDASGMRIGIVVSEWNHEITGNMLEGAKATLVEHGVSESNIYVRWVPGSFELPFAAQILLESIAVDAVICIGCVIRGETAHFDYVCQTCATGIKDVSLKYSKPVIFGVLTDDHIDQSRARSGGELGNKGVEAAAAALKLAYLKANIANNTGKDIGFKSE
jgi:6,7-dimethyl-8-ribityllumazine synthase